MSLYYIDTSAAIKLLVEESDSNAFAAFYDACAEADLATDPLLGPDLEAIVTYDDRLASAAGDAGLVTASPRS